MCALDPQCEDKPGWVDFVGDDCIAHTEICTARGGWQHLVSVGSEYFARNAMDGVSAREACCICGKGTMNAVSASCDSSRVVCMRVLLYEEHSCFVRTCAECTVD